MKGTRFRPILRDFIGQLNREFRIALTPVPRGKTWLFLVGCYNSGTTLLAKILEKHPLISALPTEGHFITDQFVKDYSIGLPRMWVEREDLFCLTELDNGPDPDRIKKEWGMRLDLNKQIYLEKSPPNTARTRWLQANFENAHFVAIVRNGYAVAEGITRKAEPHHLRGGWPIEMSAYQWRRSNEILQRDSKYLNKLIWLKYEDLVADVPGTLKSISDFISIDGFDNYESDKSWIIHERNEIIRDMNTESISRLNREQIDRINIVAGSMIESFGYEML